MKRIAPLLLAAVVVVSCTDDQPLTTAPFSNGPQAEIVDGVAGRGGYPGFYWLPELVESPTLSGDFPFDPDVPARIEICELEDTDGYFTEAEPPTDPFCPVGNSHVLFAAAEVNVDAVNEQYSAVWKTDGTSYALDSDKFYRLSVWVDGTQLGWRDLDPEDSPPSGSGGKLEPYYPFKLGNTINIKFRIDKLCLGGFGTCGACLYTTNGSEDGNNEQVGRACNTPDGQHGVYIPTGNTAINDVLVLPERIVGTVTLEDGRTLNCTPDDNPNSPTYGQVNFIKGLDVPQYPGCFFIRTFPELTDPNIDLNAVVGSCPEIPGSTDRLPVIARTDDANNPSYVQALQPASTVIGGVDFLNCDEPQSPLQSLAQVARKLIPFYAEPVDAGSLGSLKGGDAPSFSDFVWMVPSQDEPLAGDNQLGLPGTLLPEPLTVKVTDEIPAKWDGFRGIDFTSRGGTTNGITVAVAGATVTFSSPQAGLQFSEASADNTCGTDFAPTVDVTTGENGEAKACVLLPTESGTFKVFASGYGIGVKGQSWSIGGVDAVGPYSHWNTTGSSPFVGGPIALPDPPSGIEFTVTACGGTADGVLEPGELDCSKEDAISFTANVGGGQTTGYIYRFAAGGELYFAVTIPVAEQQSLKENALTLYLNTDGDTELAVGHDVLIVDGTLQPGLQFSDNFWSADCPKGQSFCAVNDASDGGTTDGSGGFGLVTDQTGPSGELAPFYFYEISHPLNTAGNALEDGFRRDIDFSTTLHAFFTIRGLGKGNKGNTEYPGPFGVYDQLQP